MIQKKPLVSVVVLISNHNDHVIRALNSLMEQSYPSLELIIVNDGSKDQSSAMVAKLIEHWRPYDPLKRKITFLQQANRETHVAINLGLYMASGEYFTILNSDDYYDPKRIETIVNQLQEQKAEWAFTGVQGIDSKGKALPVDHPWKVWYERNVFSSCLSLTIGFQILQDHIVACASNLFFSRNLYVKVGEFKNLSCTYDYDFSVRAVLFAEPLFIQEKLLFYQIHKTILKYLGHPLVEQEKKEIYKDYLLKMNACQPENKKAPSHWYWPIAFPQFRRNQKLDRGFLSDFSSYEQANLRTEQDFWERKNTFNSSFSTVKKKKRKKITLITHSLCLSGAPKVVLDLAKLLKREGHKINLISLVDGPLREEFESLGIHVYSIPQHLKYWFVAQTRFKKIQQMLKLLSSLFFKTQNTVICNCAVSWPLLFPLVLTSPFRKFFWYIHDSFSPSCMIEMGTGMNVFKRIKNKGNLKVWFGSDSTRQIWEEGIKGSVKYWSGISKQPTHPLKKDRIKNILSIGSVSPRKAPHILLDAFISCVEQKRIPNDVSLTIVGFSDDMDSYVNELLVKKNHLDLKNRIHFVVNVEANELQPFYDAADLYIQSSVVECLPLAMLHAMSMSLPIITTDVNGCTEAIQHQETGYVCVSRNSKALADTIAEAINNPEKSFQLGVNAQQKFNEIFSLEKTQEAILHEI